MTGPKGNSEFCFSETLNIDKAEEPLLQNVHEANLVQKPKDDETTHSRSEARLNSWRDKPFHGKFLSISEGQPQETEINFQWLVSGELKITSETLIVAGLD